MKENILSKNLLITTVISNLGFEKALNNLVGILIRTPFEDKFIYDSIDIKR